MNELLKFKKTSNNQWDEFVKKNEKVLLEDYEFVYENWIKDVEFIGFTILEEPISGLTDWKVEVRFTFQDEIYVLCIEEDKTLEVSEMGKAEEWEMLYYSAEFEIMMGKFAKDILGIPYEIDKW